MTDDHPVPDIELTRPSAATQRLLDSLTRNPLVVGLGILLLLGGVVLLASALGYQAGISDRGAAAATAQAGELQVQYDLAVQDIQLRYYARAIQRLEYILRIDPQYPGVGAMLADARAALAATQNGTVAAEVLPTTTPRPTLNVSSPEDLLAQIQAAEQAADWDAMVEAAVALRATYPDYQPDQAADYLFRALRNRGVSRVDGSTLQLELGLRDLDEAERLAPLDEEAQQRALWAYLYLDGGQRWDLNWGYVVKQYTTLYTVAPYFHDVQSRLTIANARYADELAAGGAPCDALPYYEASLNLQPSETVDARYQTAVQTCAEGTPTPDPNATIDPNATPTDTPDPDLPTSTPDPNGDSPTLTPTVDTGPTLTPTATPTDS